MTLCQSMFFCHSFPRQEGYQSGSGSGSGKLISLLDRDQVDPTQL